MTILRRANESSQGDWRPVPEGLWRWSIGDPELALSELYGNYRVKFPLTLTVAERDRLTAEHGDPPQGTQQSWRTNYTVGLSLGYVQKSGEFKSTKLVDFLAACFGSKNQKRFREWIAAGGGPVDVGGATADEELKAIREWLGWWKELEVYGTIRHEADSKQVGVVWARFGGPLPVGSLPGQSDPEYQAFGLGKLRAMMLEGGSTSEAPAAGIAAPMPQGAAVGAVALADKPRTYDQIFDAPENGTDDDLPF